MIRNMESRCPTCGGCFKAYDKTLRLVRSKNRSSKYISIIRVKCTNCGTVRRILPNDLLPYKQYEVGIIKGVIEGIITSDTWEFEDYPCEATMKKWKSSVKLT